MEKVKIFLSYSHVDEELKEELDKHLSGLKRLDIIETWNDREIIAGTSWSDDIFKNLDSADIVLCLVSSDFISSDFCVEKEFKKALEKHKTEKCIVVPVILRSCDWFGVMGQIQGVPRDGKPITSWTNQDEAYTNVVNSLKRTINLAADRKEKIRLLTIKKQDSEIMNCTGTIDKSNLSRPFKSKIKGTLDNLPEGYQPWIFKKPHDMDTFHPEDGPLRVKGNSWENELHIGNEAVGSHAGIQFDILLVLVSNERGEELYRYIYEQNQRNLWPGLPHMDEVKVLDQVTVTRMN